MVLLYSSKGFAVGCIEGRIALEYFDELGNKALLGISKNYFVLLL